MYSLVLSLSTLLLLIARVQGQGGLNLWYIGTSRGAITAVQTGIFFINFIFIISFELY
jgi:hypothetical protein